MGNQKDIDRANSEGRLHSSQRQQVMAGSGFGKFLFVFAIILAILASFSKTKATSLPSWWEWFPVVLMLIGALWFAGRQVLEVLLGRVKSASGWTNMEVGGKQAGRRSHLTLDYNVTLGTQTFKVSREIYATVQSQQNNTAFFTPITRCVVNIIPTEQ